MKGAKFRGPSYHVVRSSAALQTTWCEVPRPFRPTMADDDDDDDVPSDDELERTGCCSQECKDLMHGCMLVRYDAFHDKPLHSHVVCESVVMPVNGFYFCNMECLKTYNTFLAALGVNTVMPDDGPGNESFDRFLLPVRRRPDAAIEAIDEEEEKVEDDVVCDQAAFEVDEDEDEGEAGYGHSGGGRISGEER